MRMARIEGKSYEEDGGGVRGTGTRSRRRRAVKWPTDSGITQQGSIDTTKRNMVCDYLRMKVGDIINRNTPSFPPLVSLPCLTLFMKMTWNCQLPSTKMNSKW